MPCYEFFCQQCDEAFEQMLPVDKRESGKCPRCGTETSSRLISLPAKAQIKEGRTLPMAGGCGSDNCCGGMCGGL